ncbi:MAG: methyltransferase domain-containing protein [Verrucomicrobia bacterium]|nr:methyltransferase domain-containing protein [Verrucomicrobiota bacterium]
MKSFPQCCTSLLNRACDLFWEARLGIRTLGGESSLHPDAEDYGYLAYHTYFSMFDRLALQPSDVVADLGCGKGRVVCIAATYRVKEVIGIEIDPSLCAQAETNAARMRRRRAPVRFACQSAADFNYSDVTAVVMFHPFGADTLREVLGNWRRSLQARPRVLRVVYSNPLLGSMIAGQPWIELCECWNPSTWSRLKFPVNFYRSVPA